MHDTRLKKILRPMGQEFRLRFLIRYAIAYGKIWEHYFDAKGRTRRRKRRPKEKTVDPETLKTLLAMLVPVLDGIVKKTPTRLDDMAWEVVKAILLAKGPQIAAELHKEMVANGMAPKPIDNVT